MTRRRARAGAHLAQRMKPAEVAVIALPALLTLYLAFNGGGFFAGQPALVAAALALVLALRVTLGQNPGAGIGPFAAAAAAALGLLVVWTLLSFIWSDAPARAIVEFDRVLMFWLALVLFASVPRRTKRVEWALRALWGAIVVIAVAALATRMFPEALPIARSIQNDRISYPLEYWNALGIMSALGLVFALHLAASERGSVLTRVLGASSAPILASTLVLTFSRGAILAGIVGALVYLAAARPRGALGGLLATAPPTAFAAVASYQAELLAREDFTSAAAMKQGEELALIVAGCALAAAALRLALSPVDRRLADIQLADRSRRRITAGVAAAAIGIAIVAATAFGGASYASRQFDRFVEGSQITRSGDPRGRLTNVGNNGRLDHWEVALDAFERAPLTGIGAGTYAIEWGRVRERPFRVEDAHSLYVEILGELGLVGLVLLAVALLTVLAGFAGQLGRRDRHVYAALLAAGVAWTAHAGIDWDWEMPATGLWLFCLGGMCLARPAARQRHGSEAALGNFPRVVIGVGLLALAITPALVAISQARLNSAVRALKQGNCPGAIDSALGATRALGVRPEPYVVLALCDVRLDRRDISIQVARRAVRLDPENWRTWYTLAIAQANAGADPRPAGRRARRLNPLSALARDAVRRFDTADPQKWRRRARSARLPIE